MVRVVLGHISDDKIRYEVKKTNNSKSTILHYHYNFLVSFRNSFVIAVVLWQGSWPIGSGTTSNKCITEGSGKTDKRVLKRVNTS